MATCNILVGNAVNISVTFTPDSGSVALADVHVRLRDPEGNESELTPVVEDGVNQFSYVYSLADDAKRGTWYVRVESDAPSPEIAAEGSFTVKGSKFATP